MLNKWDAWRACWLSQDWLHSFPYRETFFGWVSNTMCSRTWADRAHWFRDYLLGCSKSTAEWKASVLHAAESGSEESATQSFDLAVPAAWGNRGCLCTTYEEQVGILQKQSCEKPEVPDVNIIANVITFPLLWKYCLVIWLSWWQEEVRAEFLLGSLRGEGPKGKTWEGLCNI